jgi:hypothetical protein
MRFTSRRCPDGIANLCVHDGHCASLVKVRVNVSGTWVNGTVTVHQDGDHVVFDGQWGHAEGNFSGPNIFTMHWNAGATFTATVNQGVMHWNNNTQWVQTRRGF